MYFITHLIPHTFSLLTSVKVQSMPWLVLQTTQLWFEPGLASQPSHGPSAEGGSQYGETPLIRCVG